MPKFISWELTQNLEPRTQCPVSFDLRFKNEVSTQNVGGEITLKGVPILDHEIVAIDLG